MKENNFENLDHDEKPAENSKEMADKEFILKAENVEKEIDDYIEAVDSYKNSEKGKELMKNSTEILNVLAYAKEKEYNDMIEEQLEA